MAGLSELRHLLQSQGWELLSKHIQSQVDARVDNLVLNPLTGLDQTFGQEYVKGEIQALRMVAQLPKTLVEQAELFIKERDSESEDQRNTDDAS